VCRPLPGPVMRQVIAPVSRWQKSLRWLGPGRTQEAALKQLCVWEVSTSEMPSRQAPSLGWASRCGRRQMSGEAGKASLPNTHRLPSGQQEELQSPLRRLGPGQPLAWAGSQPGGWGLGQKICPRPFRPGAGMRQGALWVREEGSQGSIQGEPHGCWTELLASGDKCGAQKGQDAAEGLRQGWTCQLPCVKI
jgi:hypothetical protein